MALYSGKKIKGGCIMKKIGIVLLLMALSGIMLHADMVDFSEITLTNPGYGASSVLKEKNKPDDYYGPGKAFDGDSATSWCEGRNGDGIGEYITLTMDPVKIYGLAVLNGFGKVRHLYYQNNRVKDFRLTLYPVSGKEKVITGTFGKDLCGRELAGGKLTIEEFCSDYSEEYQSYDKCLALKKDECIMNDYDRGGQRILLKKPMTVKKIRLDILSVYKGKKYSDTCIAGIMVLDYNLGDFGTYDQNNKEKKY